jgi:DNA modification methylase
MPTVELRHGDCIEVMATLPDNSIDSIVTDPPYGLEFMGKEWDAPWKGTDAAHVKARELRADEMSVESKRPYIAAAVNKFEAGLPFQQWCTAWAAEALRVLKPGGHLLAFGGTRTYHRLAVAIEDAGFEIRDSMMWLYGSGFPKSHDVSKAIDKNNGETGRKFKFTRWMCTTGVTAREINEITKTQMGNHYLTHPTQPAIPTPELWQIIRPLCGDVPDWVDELVARIAAEREVVGRDTKARSTAGKSALPTLNGTTVYETWNITAPATDSAKQWHGWGTALKPAHEPIVVARKPLIGTVAENVLEWGVGAMNIDGCRIGTEQRINSPGSTNPRIAMNDGWRQDAKPTLATGRWPANVVLSHTIFCDDICADGCPVAELDRQSGVTVSRKNNHDDERLRSPVFGDGKSSGGKHNPLNSHNDTGGASRFFYVAKANKRERPNVDGVAHPTVKPLALMQWLVRLVTPAGGTVLEPFAGSGTTVEAALLEGCNVLAIEKTEDYLPLINARIERVASAR